jgi:hypothetical protein
MSRTLPSLEESLRILAERRTRPPRRPTPVAARAVAGTLKAFEGKFGKGADGLKAHWNEIVGASLARRTEPVKLVRPRSGGPGSLEVRVDGPAATIVQHQAGEIVARVNLFLGEGAIERLRIVQGPLRNGLRQPTTTRARARGPLDAAKERKLADSLADLPEGPLKAALTRLGREVMRDEAT